MKKSRQILKESTRSKIIERTKELVISNGILNTSTKQISDHCQLAHGTIFAHFSSREELFGHVIKNELIRIAKSIKTLEEANGSFEELLNQYLDLVAEEESFLTVTYKEFPFLGEMLQREIITTESIVKKLFYERIEEGIARGEYKPVNITATLSFLFGTIQFYLVRKELLTDAPGIIGTKKIEMIEIFLTLLSK